MPQPFQDIMDQLLHTPVGRKDIMQSLEIQGFPLGKGLSNFLICRKSGQGGTPCAILLISQPLLQDPGRSHKIKDLSTAAQQVPVLFPEHDSSSGSYHLTGPGAYPADHLMFQFPKCFPSPVLNNLSNALAQEFLDQLVGISAI
jgi:hypothetical protein